MKTYLWMAVAIFCFCAESKAQVYTMDWASSFTPAWVTGNTSGTANNIGGSAVNCTVSMTKSGGVFTTTQGPLGGPNTPTVSSATYKVATGPGTFSPSCMQVALDYATNTDYTDIVFTFSQPVWALNFNISDIDRLTNTSYNYLDRITITGTNGVIPRTPTITKFDNSDPNFLIVSGNEAHVNPANNMAGNTASDNTDQKGTIKVDFGNVFLTTIKIRYDNFAGTIADPTVQNIAIGNISFQKTIPLSVSLLSFSGIANENGTMTLSWSAEKESDFAYYALERSENKMDFKEIGRVEGRNDVTAYSYQFVDNHVNAATCFYRLRMVDLDGTYSFSKVIVLTNRKSVSFHVFPTVVDHSMRVLVSVPKSGDLKFMIRNMAGQQVFVTRLRAITGNNEMQVNLPDLPSGQYLATLDNYGKSALIVRR